MNQVFEIPPVPTNSRTYSKHRINDTLSNPNIFDLDRAIYDYKNYKFWISTTLEWISVSQLSDESFEEDETCGTYRKVSQGFEISPITCKYDRQSSKYIVLYGHRKAACLRNNSYTHILSYVDREIGTDPHIQEIE